jgi:transcription elongation factor Elf1
MNNNKGYFDSSKWPFTTPELKLEVHTVICNNCNATWQEEIKRLTSSIAGYARRYDFCSLCEQNYIKNRGSMNLINLKPYGIGLDPNTMRAFREAQEFKRGETI